MKKAIPLLLAVALVLALVGCASQSGEPSVPGTITPPSVTPAATPDASPADATDAFPTIQLMEVDANLDAFKDIPFAFGPGNPASDGPRWEYPEDLEHIYSMGIIDSLYLVQILYAYTREEAEKLDGYNEEYHGHDVIYRAVLLYDFMKSEEMNVEVNFAGGPYPDRSIQGIPMWLPGQTFITFVLKHKEGKITHSLVVGFDLDPNAKTFDESTIVYNTSIEFDAMKSIDKLVTADERNIVTSQKENPVIRYQKFNAADIVKLLIDDYKECEKNAAQ